MKKLIIFVVLVCAGVAVAYTVHNHRQNGKNGADAENRTVKVERGPIRLTVASTGRVVSNLDVEIKCKASGEIIKLPYDISDEVKEGDLLLELDPIDENRNVQRAEVQTSASTARLAQARLNLQTAEQQLINDEKSAEANVRSAEAAAKDAKAKAGRMRLLLERERVSKEECETAETAATRAEVELENARIRLKEIDVQREALNVRRQDVVLAEAQLKSDEIALDMARQRLIYTKVYVPTASAYDTTTTRARVAPDRARSRPEGMRGDRGRMEGRRRGFRSGEAPWEPGMTPPDRAGQRFRGTRGSDPFPFDDAATTRAAGGPGRAGFGSRGMRGERGSLQGRGRSSRPSEGQREFDRTALAMARQRLGDARGSGPSSWDDDRPATGPRWVVATRDVQIGQIISSPMNNVGGGTALMTLSDLSRIFVMASVDESGIGQIALGQPVEITADAFPEAFFRGQVVRIATRGESVSNVVTFEVKIEVMGRGKEKLKPEMTTNVEIIVAENTDALLLPAEAIQRERRQRFVQLPGADGAPGEKREVETGIDNGYMVEIVSGLEEGQGVALPKSGIQSQWARGGPGGPGRAGMRSRMMMRTMGGGRRR